MVTINGNPKFLQDITYKTSILKFPHDGSYPTVLGTLYQSLEINTFTFKPLVYVTPWLWGETRDNPSLHYYGSTSSLFLPTPKLKYNCLTYATWSLACSNHDTFLDLARPAAILSVVTQQELVSQVGWGPSIQHCKGTITWLWGEHTMKKVKHGLVAFQESYPPVEILSSGLDYGPLFS